MQKFTNRMVWGALVASLCFGFALTAPSAGATELASPAQEVGECYPDGCTPPTDPPTDPEPTCGIEQSSVRVGDEVTVTVQNVPDGGTIRVLLDGEEVGSATNGTPQGIRALPAQAAPVSVTFTVPDLDAGTYTLVAVGDTFTVTCGSNGLTIGDGSGGGSLPRTGLSILGFLVVGLALVGGGYTLVQRSRSRRYEAA